MEIWLRVMDREGIEIAVCFPTGSGKVASLQEPAYAAGVARACNDHFAKEYKSRSGERNKARTLADFSGFLST